MSETQKEGGDDRPERLSEPDACCCACGKGSENCDQMWDESENRAFYCCCPLSFGIMFMDFTIFFIIVFLFIDACFMFFNYYIDYIYPFGIIACIMPGFFAIGIWCAFQRSETKDGRGWLQVGVVLVIISLILVCIWTLYYFSNMYQYKYVYQGYGDPDDGDEGDPHYGDESHTSGKKKKADQNYTRMTKKEKYIQTVFFTILCIALLLYFIAALSTWKSLARN